MKLRLLKSIVLFVAVTMVSATYSWAQRTITGTVTDAETGETLISANVEIKGTSLGTVTDFDGNYTLEVPDEYNTLLFSYIGFTEKEVEIGASNVIDVQLSQGTALDEVVVVGYGAVKREDVTGSVSSLAKEDFNQGIVANPDQLIQGRVPGVNVVNNSGQPGGEATVKIRGNNSIRAGANPLYVVDGIPLDGRSARAGLFSTDIGSIPNSNPLNFLNGNDIEQIDILKDASSAAIYGARAANGVILVTTKKGRSSEPQVDLNVSLGTSAIRNKYDILDGNEYRSALNEYGLEGDGGGNVDAFDAILQNGFTQDYGLSIGGGSENSHYRVSLGYLDTEGIIKESSLKRYNAVLNAGFDLLDDRAGIDVLTITSHAIEEIAPISTNAGFTGNLVGQALQWNPTIPLMQNGDFTTNANNSTNATVGATTINPLQLLAAHDETANTTTILASISPYLHITDDLTYRYRYGVNYGRGVTEGNIRGFVNVQDIENEGYAALSNTTLLSQIHSHTLNYKTNLGSSIDMDALVGYEYQKFDFSGNGMAGRGFDVLDRNNVPTIQNGDPGNRVVFGFADPISELQSYFGRVNVGLGERLDLTVNVRADGSSKFGDNNKYGVFPSVAARWNLDKEAFMQNGLFDALALRVGWGQTGNQEFPAGAAQSRYQLIQGGAQQENVANPDLRWETSTTANVGVDFALFDYKLTGTVEYFSRVTDDLLLDPFVSEPGPAVRAWQNISGEVVNNGVELLLNTYLIENSNVSFNVGVNAAYINNEFRNYEGATLMVGQLFGQGTSNAFSQIIDNNLPLNTFNLREYQGLDADGNSIYTNDGELFVAGDPNADLILGFNTYLEVSDLFFGMNFNGAFGHQIYNNTKMSVIPIGNLGSRNIDASLLEGDVMESTANPITPSDRFLEDADFVKLSNATLGYNIGDIGAFKNLTVSVTGQNLFVITGYSGFDPEVNTVNLVNGIPSNGIEYIPYPTARTFLLNFNVSF